MVVLGPHQDWNCRFIEPSALTIPFLDTVQGALTSKVEHKEDSDGVIANQGEHVDEFALTTQVPNGEGNLCVADGYCLLHEVDAQGLDVVLIPTSLDIFDH